MNIIIREAHVQDAGTIAAFQLALAGETENVKLDQNMVGKGVEAVFSDSSKGIYYVAESGGKVVGSMMMTKEWSDWRNGHVLWFQSVYVIPEYRRRQVFTKMYAYIHEMMNRDTGITGLRLYVDSSNTRARDVYRALGMNGDHYLVFEKMKDKRG